MKNQPKIYGNKLTLPDRVVEWSICKYKFINQCKEGDIIIHDRITALELAKLFNSAVDGLDIDTDTKRSYEEFTAARSAKQACRNLSSIFFMNWIWLKDNFNPDAIIEDPVLKTPVFKKSYVVDTNNIDNLNTYRDNIIELK